MGFKSIEVLTQHKHKHYNYTIFAGKKTRTIILHNSIPMIFSMKRAALTMGP